MNKIFYLSTELNHLSLRLILAMRKQYKKRKFRTSRLINKNNFIIGMSSAFAISGNYFEFNFDLFNGAKEDEDAIRNDWNVIGEDIQLALEEFNNG